VVALTDVEVVVALAKFGLVALTRVEVVLVLSVDLVVLRYHCEMFTVVQTL